MNRDRDLHESRGMPVESCVREGFQADLYRRGMLNELSLEQLERGDDLQRKAATEIRQLRNELRAYKQEAERLLSQVNRLQARIVELSDANE